MKKSEMTILGFMCIFVCGLIAAFHLGWSAVSIALKTLASACFFVLGLFLYRRMERNRLAGKFMIMAFFCSLCGDVLLALDRNNGIMFVIGVASFAAAHILFSVSFCKMKGLAKADAAVTLALFMITLAILVFGGEFDYQGLFAVLVAYAAIISFMVAKALSLGKSTVISGNAAKLIAVGAVLFLISDIILLYWLFGINMPPIVQSANWGFYYAAQACLAGSMSIK